MKRVEVKLDFRFGPAIRHNLICWHCNKEGAVYDAYPNFVFIPCWKCQKKFQSDYWNPPKWKIFWRELLNL